MYAPHDTYSVKNIYNISNVFNSVTLVLLTCYHWNHVAFLSDTLNWLYSAFTLRKYNTLPCLCGCENSLFKSLLFLVLSMEDDTVDLTCKTYCKSNWYDWATSLGWFLTSSLIGSPLLFIWVEILYSRVSVVFRVEYGRRHSGFHF